MKVCLLIKVLVPCLGQINGNCHKLVCTRPLSAHWVGRLIFFFFFVRTVRELSFPICCFKFHKWGKLRTWLSISMKRIFKSVFVLSCAGIILVHDSSHKPDSPRQTLVNGWVRVYSGTTIVGQRGTEPVCKFRLLISRSPPSLHNLLLYMA